MMIKKKVVLIYLIPILMFFFFIRNLILVETQQMDSWMGGGMRMFGKIDKMLYRVSGFDVSHNGKKYFVNLRNIPEFEDEDVSLRILPNEHGLSEVLSKVKKYSWCYDEKTDSIRLKKTKNNCTVDIAKESILRIQVFVIDYEERNHQIQLKPINNSTNE